MVPLYAMLSWTDNCYIDYGLDEGMDLHHMEFMDFVLCYYFQDFLIDFVVFVFYILKTYIRHYNFFLSGMHIPGMFSACYRLSV